LRLAHPLLPFITEEIWQRIAPLAGVTAKNRPSIETIMLQPYPQADESRIDAIAMEEIEWVKNFILGIRKIRGEMNIAPGKPLPVLLQNGDDNDQQLLAKHQLLLTTLARIESIQWLDTTDSAPESAMALCGDMRILIPMAGLIDKDAELTRLGKEIEKREKELERSKNKLQNPSFVDRAPAEVVDKERQKLADMRSALDNLRAQQDKIRKL
jgi:valyl-tRNA synthetase